KGNHIAQMVAIEVADLVTLCPYVGTVRAPELESIETTTNFCSPNVEGFIRVECDHIRSTITVKVTEFIAGAKSPTAVLPTDFVAQADQSPAFGPFAVRGRCVGGLNAVMLQS